MQSGSGNWAGVRRRQLRRHQAELQKGLVASLNSVCCGLQVIEYREGKLRARQTKLQEEQAELAADQAALAEEQRRLAERAAADRAAMEVTLRENDERIKAKHDAVKAQVGHEVLGGCLSRHAKITGPGNCQADGAHMVKHSLSVLLLLVQAPPQGSGQGMQLRTPLEA